jgi:hypothetical protein
MTWVIRGLPAEAFVPLYGLSDGALGGLGVLRQMVVESPGSPCRVTLEDAAVGEPVLLLNYEHQAAATPYRARHAIFVREGARRAARYEGTVPPVLARRLLSIRAFDASGMMVDADVLDGGALHARIPGFFANPAVAYLHAHNAKPGCFAARIDRG